MENKTFAELFPRLCLSREDICKLLRGENAEKGVGACLLLTLVAAFSPLLLLISVIDGSAPALRGILAAACAVYCAVSLTVGGGKFHLIAAAVPVALKLAVFRECSADGLFALAFFALAYLLHRIHVRKSGVTAFYDEPDDGFIKVEIPPETLAGLSEKENHEYQPNQPNQEK